MIWKKLNFTVTNNNEEYIGNSKEAFKEMADSLNHQIVFYFVADPHDRSIDMDNGWKIVLGRGLDIYQKTNGWHDIAEYYQEKRLCKGCEITYVKTK